MISEYLDSAVPLLSNLPGVRPRFRLGQPGPVNLQVVQQLLLGPILPSTRRQGRPAELAGHPLSDEPRVRLGQAPDLAAAAVVRGRPAPVSGGRRCWHGRATSFSPQRLQARSLSQKRTDTARYLSNWTSSVDREVCRLKTSRLRRDQIT